ncbi:hypothetical protein E1180_05865 [Roseibium denhamense]|uniref:DUF2842 domain-containing protein n=1 Tax=Roseibium denhamense TaxID=76305 RepID=A0ABY1NHJ6_9HYPH|nr:hypothetical protein [Roseibium denhamense]MTI05037.1 hypothetical protein [Roseibium denhamense]SMP09960.1 hypothetical protein SAMN06265374_1159 [Roseibium denhamense]
METAAFLIELGRYYLYAGGVVAAAFLVVGIDRVEPSANGSYAFRPLLIPGICLIWPLVLYRWISLERARGGQP